VQSRPREIRIYESENGKRPFSDWMDELEGQRVYGIILNRIDRVEKGNLGDCDGVGEGVSELRIDFGPGY
jgi:putative addiction module killer protein